MGIYLAGTAKQEGIPKELALFFKNKMGIKNFIGRNSYCKNRSVGFAPCAKRTHFDNRKFS